MHVDRSRLTRRSLLKGAGALGLAHSLPPRALAAPADGSLKITKFVIHKAKVRADWRWLLFLEVHTDGGIVGLGAGPLPLRTTIVEEALRWIEKEMVGRDPAGPEEHWDRLYYRTARWRSGAVLMTALSAVDTALWDIEGKRLGVPVWRLLGGPLHRELRAYHSHWTFAMKRYEPDDFARRAEATVKKGWTAVKWSVIGDSARERTRHTVAALKAIRGAVGDSLDIGLEMSEKFTLRSALEFAHSVAPYKPMFIEEPIWREKSTVFGVLAERSPVPVATGEGHLSRMEFKPLLDVNGAAIIQPDVTHCGGITELRKIASLAETYDVEVAPHSSYGPIAHVASLHTMSVCRNFFIHEWEAEDDSLHQEVTNGTFPVINKNGLVPLPAGPGLGLDFDGAEMARRFPIA